MRPSAALSIASALARAVPSAASASRATFFASAIPSAVVTNLGFAAQIGQYVTEIRHIRAAGRRLIASSRE